MLLRLMMGGQVSLLVGVLATAIGGAFGVMLGVSAGYFGGRLDEFLMRFTDGMIALPLLPLLIVLGALDLTKLGFSAEFARSGAAGFWRIVVIISLVDWTGIARMPAPRHCRSRSGTSYALPGPAVRARSMSWRRMCCPISRRR